MTSAQFQVRHQDEHLAIVSKCAGLIVHGGPGIKETTLADELGKLMPLAQAAGPDRPGIVHRLDRDTSGLLVIAKTDEALEALKAAMKTRSIRRTYLALVLGKFAMPGGRIEAPIDRSEKQPYKQAVAGTGKPSVTEFEVKEDLNFVSYVNVKLVTGRTHQIRVHFAHIKHPVVGDMTYGKRTAEVARGLGLERPFLHAVRLEFQHPFTGIELSVTEPLPVELEVSLQAARKMSPVRS